MTEIPKKIWTYWNSDNIPWLVQSCIDGWKRLHPDYEINVITPSNVHTKIPMDMMIADFDKIPPYRQSDWVRVAVISFFGGIWLDASFILTARLDWIPEYLRRFQKTSMVFTFSPFMTIENTPTIENWFIAAPANNSFVNAWLKEVEIILKKHNGIEKAYLDELKGAVGDEMYNKLVQKISDPEYLVMYVAANKVVYSDGIPSPLVMKAEESAWKVQTIYDWNDEPFASWIMTGSGGIEWKVEHDGADEGEDIPIPALIKLRSQDRGAIEEYIQRGKPITENSVGARFLRLKN